MGVTGWRKRHQFLLLRQRLIAAAAVLCVGLAPTQSYSECTAKQEQCVALALGKPGFHRSLRFLVASLRLACPATSARAR